MRVAVLIMSDGKGVHCEVESEVSLKQTLEPTSRNFIRGYYMWMMLLKKQKSNTVQNV
jgi:hypothetical protein